MQKLMLLLQAGVTLSLTARPDAMFRVIRDTARELKEIDERALRRAIRSLYHSQLVGYTEHKDGTVTLFLTKNGKKRALTYNLKTLSIQKPPVWDGWWRIVAFDIPERLREGRTFLVDKLKQLGFLPLQKSVFVLPYECKDELDFVIELFELRPYVRLIRAKEIDTGLHLKRKFGIS